VSDEGEGGPGQFEPRGAVPNALSWAVIGGGLVAVLVALLAFSGGGARPPSNHGKELPTLPVPTQRAAGPSAIPQAQAVVLGGRQMLLVGQMFEGGCYSQAPNVVDGPTREAAMVVELRGRGRLYLGRAWAADWRLERVTERSAQMTATINGRYVRLYVVAVAPGTKLRQVPEDEIRIFNEEPDARPAVMLYLQDETGLPVHMELDCAGQLYVSPAPVAREAVVEHWTGERLEIDPEKAVGAGIVFTQPPSPRPRYGTYWTDCQATRCAAVWRAGLLRLPQPGRLRCGEDGAWRFDPEDAEGVTFVFREIVEGLAARGCEAGFDQRVGAGEYLPAGAYRVSAIGGTGEALDVAISLEGRLFAGQIRPKEGCPCRFGW
jgi:hypothetical protein